MRRVSTTLGERNRTDIVTPPSPLSLPDFDLGCTPAGVRHVGFNTEAHIPDDAGLDVLSQVLQAGSVQDITVRLCAEPFSGPFPWSTLDDLLAAYSPRCLRILHGTQVSDRMRRWRQALLEEEGVDGLEDAARVVRARLPRSVAKGLVVEAGPDEPVNPWFRPGQHRNVDVVAVHEGL